MNTRLLADVLEQIKNGDIVSVHDLSRFLHTHHQPQMTFTQDNIISDGFVEAAHKDPNLINPWGVSFSSTGPFWVSDAGTGVTTIYDGEGNAVPIAGHTAIDIGGVPGQAEKGTPTGQVFNTTANGFQVSADGVTAKSTFIFVTTQGTISGWAPTDGAVAEVRRVKQVTLTGIG